MDKIFYTNAELTEKSGVPQGSDLPQVNFELLEFDLSSLPSGLTIYDIEWTSEGITTDLAQAEIDKDLKISQDATNKSARDYLDSTDWYAVRFSETGEAIPEDVKAKRAEERLKVV